MVEIAGRLALTETILIVDYRNDRRKKLVEVLCGSYSINQKEYADELDAGPKPDFAIVHRNNWAARNGWNNFRGKLEKMNIPFVIFSAGGHDQVLHLEKGDEYCIDDWREYLNSKVSSLDIFYKPELKEFIAKMAPLGLNNIPLDFREWVIADAQCWYNQLDEKQKESLKSFFKECNHHQGGHGEFPTNPVVLACLARRYL